MTADETLTPTEGKMLKSLIDIYIETGRPVSSKMIKRAFGLQTSTANIRKILHRLEEKGYLFKQHISSGRVPADSGYRYYVDEIETSYQLSSAVLDEISRKIRRDWGDIRVVMARISRLLGELTNYMGLIMGVFHPDSTVERLKIIQSEARGGIVILELDGETDRRVFIDLMRRYAPHIIDRAVQVVNERISGYPLKDATDRLNHFLREGTGLEREIIQDILREAEDLFEWPHDLIYHFKGLNKQPAMIELVDPVVLQNMVRIMGERNLMLNIMKRRMEHESMVTIGRENVIDELETFSVVTRRFDLEGCNGLLGVVGPTRMSYSRVLSLLSKMAEELHRQRISSI